MRELGWTPDMELRNLLQNGPTGALGTALPHVCVQGCSGAAGAGQGSSGGAGVWAGLQPCSGGQGRAAAVQPGSGQGCSGGAGAGVRAGTEQWRPPPSTALWATPLTCATSYPRNQGPREANRGRTG